MTDEHGLPDRVDLAIRAGRYRTERDQAGAEYRALSRQLKAFFAWCREKAAEPGADPLWARMAAEIDAYWRNQPNQQDGLF